jgi:(E)-4-hydroxy-3-methylbut-2-enyl-diphosphate synthase
MTQPLKKNSSKLYYSHKLRIGLIEVGGDAPIRIQSMTNTDTMDTDATVEQCIRIIQAGADFVRLTVRNQKEAENLKNIKNELNKRGFDTPLIADVHFNPKIAEISAVIVDKVRINPGNFAGDDFEDKLVSLLEICKKNKTTIRIGVNHGSLSERIMQKYGDTPEGMVESAMEYLRICTKENFSNIVVSLKSSNTRIMIWSNRLLVKTMQDEGMHFPVHLGVTEAGEGEDGRFRSSVGIGTLMSEGIGDTIRISLTEDPEKEIPVARKLVSLFRSIRNEPENIPDWNQLTYLIRKSGRIMNIGDTQVPVVISSADNFEELTGNHENDITPDYVFLNNKNDFTPDHFYTTSENKFVDPVKGISLITDSEQWQSVKKYDRQCFPLFSLTQFIKNKKRSPFLNFVYVLPEEIENLKYSEHLKDNRKYVLVIQAGPGNQISLYHAINTIIRSGLTNPLIIRATYTESDLEMFILKISVELGRYFIDKLADGIWLENSNFTSSENARLAFNLLQAARARIFKTEYIACPSCGRTLFNIQDTLANVKAATSHLKNMKIAVMGCIVNGPGEMADADYGLVGSAPGKMTLFKQKKIIKKNIPEENAISELINLIKDCNDWIDP